MERTRTSARRRRAPLVVTFGGLAGMMAMAAIALACTAHTGNIWFCPKSSPSCSTSASAAARTFSISDATFFVKATGLSTYDSTQTINYVSTAASADAPCMFSPLVMETAEVGDDNTVDVNTFSGDVAATSMIMPNVAGEWTACATYETNNVDPDSKISASNHYNFFTR